MRKYRLENLIKEIVNEQDFAIGNDVVFMPNFEESYNTLFQQKVYTTEEIAYCDQFEESLLRYASTWAAKEAVYKAVKQINPSPIFFKKIEISRNKIGGKPSVKLPHLYANLHISISITHDGDYVWAVAIARKSQE